MGRGAWTDAIQVLSCDRLGWQSESKSHVYFFSRRFLHIFKFMDNSQKTRSSVCYLCRIEVGR